MKIVINTSNQHIQLVINVQHSNTKNVSNGLILSSRMLNNIEAQKFIEILRKMTGSQCGYETRFLSKQWAPLLAIEKRVMLDTQIT